MGMLAIVVSFIIGASVVLLITRLLDLLAWFDLWRDS